MRERPRLRRALARAWSVLTSIALVVVAALALLLVGVPFALGAETHTVLTGSMRPGIPPGALVAVRPTPPGDVRIGDVVTYQRTSGRPDLVTHRVIGIDRTTAGIVAFTTRGNDNGADDPPVLPVQLRGTVVYVVPWLGYANLLVDGSTRSSAVMVLAVGIIVYGVVVLVRDGRRRARARSAAAWATVLIVAGASVPSGPAAYAAACPEDALQLRTATTDWVSGAGVALFTEGAVLAPGERTRDALWVRNTADVAADLHLVFRWTAAENTPADLDAATALVVEADGVPLTADVARGGDVLEPGQARRIDVALGLTTDAGDDARRGRITVAASVVLSEHLRTRPLPSTGGGAAPLVLAGGIALMVLGTAAVQGARAARVSEPRPGRRGSRPRTPA